MPTWIQIKLIVACLVVAAFILFLVYFFTLIGEQKILLQLSPLFIGLPIVGVVGQLLRIHASYRQYLQDLTESEKNRFLLGGPEALFIPKTFLKNKAEQELMREIITSQIGSKARLLNA